MVNNASRSYIDLNRLGYMGLGPDPIKLTTEASYKGIHWTEPNKYDNFNPESFLRSDGCFQLRNIQSMGAHLEEWQL